MRPMKLSLILGYPLNQRCSGSFRRPTGHTKKFDDALQVDGIIPSDVPELVELTEIEVKEKVMIHSLF